MIKLKITTDTVFSISGIVSITKVEDIGTRNIDYKYFNTIEPNSKFNFFEVDFGGNIKILAVAGKVEQWESPDDEQKITEWDKPKGV